MDSGARRPTQASLRRAASTAYYSLFHCLARSVADRLIGGKGYSVGNPAWHQVYRALEHGFAANACRNESVMAKVSPGVRHFASMFVTLQEERHRADYDVAEFFYTTDVLDNIRDAESAIDAYERAPPEDRRAFVAHVLFKRRR